MLLGEYCGVVKTGAMADQESSADPEGFGGLRQDKLKNLEHTQNCGALFFSSLGVDYMYLGGSGCTVSGCSALLFPWVHVDHMYSGGGRPQAVVHSPFSILLMCVTSVNVAAGRLFSHS